LLVSTEQQQVSWSIRLICCIKETTFTFYQEEEKHTHIHLKEILTHVLCFLLARIHMTTTYPQTWQQLGSLFPIVKI